MLSLGQDHREKYGGSEKEDEFGQRFPETHIIYKKIFQRVSGRGIADPVFAPN